MINSHKEFVGEIKNFCDKFDLIKDFKYLKDIDGLIAEVIDSKPRVFVLSLDNITFSEDYNVVASYRFVISDETMNDTDSVIESESENMFTVSALSDYLNHIADADIDLGVVEAMTEADNKSVYSSFMGTINFNIKRKPSYWKEMEAYSV